MPGNITVGRGKLYIGAYTGSDYSTPPIEGAFEYVGNCSEISYTPAETELDHQDYSGGSAGFKVIDDTVTLDMGVEGTFTTDHITAENLCRFIYGDVSAGHIRGLTIMGGRYQLRFDQNNAKGTNYRYVFKKVKLSPGGAFGLIADEWQKMQFKFKTFKDEDNYPTCPFMEIYTTTTTSTTTTTTTTAP